MASDGTQHYAALTTTDARTVVESYLGTSKIWSAEFTGTAGPLAASRSGTFKPHVVALALAGQGDVGGGTVTGEPGAILLGLEATTGQPRFRLPLASNEWVVVSSIAATDTGFVVGGSFSGSLRIKDTVVTSGAKSDGFVASVTATGELVWLVRIGGPGADAVQGVATSKGRIAVAGTFAAGADLLGAPLPAFDDKSPFADAFVAELTSAGTRVWSASFGGKQAETVAGVAIDEHGTIAVAASARDTVHVGGLDLTARGPSDGLVAWWNKDGSANHAILVGGTDFDGLRSIVATGDRIVVGGFYSGTLDLNGNVLAAGGGDGAFIAAFDRPGRIVDVIDLEGPGREEVVALGAIPGGIIAGVAHTASVSVAGTTLPAPADPLTGAALVVRGIR